MNNRLQQGIEQLNRLGENAAQRVMDLFKDISADFAIQLIENFGDIFSRPTLDIKMRELITIASITTLGFAPDRLRTHIAGALKVGVSKQEIVETIMQMANYAGYPAAVNAMLVAKEVFALELELNTN